MGVCMSALESLEGGGHNSRGVGGSSLLSSLDKVTEFYKANAATLRRGGNLALQRAAVPEQYVQQAMQVIPAMVVIYSGCEDSQTSADVGDVTSFGLPPVSAAQKAGGACTNGLLSVFKSKPKPTYGEVLLDMRSTLKARGYEQIPQLSSSRQIDMANTVFSFNNPIGPGNRRAVLVGINYTGHSSGQLNGCVNDVRMMEQMLLQAGYSASEMHILTDDPSYGRGMPTRANIEREFQWLVQGAKRGDSLAVHYSGHGTSAGASADEADGRDEAIVPLDYDRAGLILDNDLFKMLVAPLPEGAQLVGVFDCCHSGTIIDLPFIFSATNEGADALSSGSVSLLGANGQFSFTNALKLIAQVAQKMGVFGGGSSTQQGGTSSDANYKSLAAAFLAQAMKGSFTTQ